MHFKISQEQVTNLMNFVGENLLTKHGTPILQLLKSLPKLEEPKQEEPSKDA